MMNVAWSDLGFMFKFALMVYLGYCQTSMMKLLREYLSLKAILTIFFIITLPCLIIPWVWLLREEVEINK